jgi:AcrR family transcriptional regulator
MSGLRDRKRLQTRRAIQEHALRLFLEHGYDATTVADVAAAADVSSMTVFRYFPTKEDLVLADEYDPLIIERISSRPAGEPLLRRIGEGLLAGTAELPEEARALVLARIRLIMGTPALRARLWESQFATQEAIAAALQDENPFRVRIAAGACLAAASAALMRWASEDGRSDLGELMKEALEVITQ